MTNAQAITKLLQFGTDVDISDAKFIEALWSHLENGLLTKQEFGTIIQDALDRSFSYGMDLEAELSAVIKAA